MPLPQLASLLLQAAATELMLPHAPGRTPTSTVLRNRRRANSAPPGVVVAAHERMEVPSVALVWPTAPFLPEITFHLSIEGKVCRIGHWRIDSTLTASLARKHTDPERCEIR